MKKWVIIVICIIIGFSFLKKDEKWRPFSSNELEFSIMMPGAPKDNVRKEPTALGPIDIHFFICTKGKSAYAIAVNKFPIILGKDKIDYVLDGAGSDIEKSTHGKVWEQTRITFGEYPGRDVKAKDVDGGKLVTTLIGKYDLNLRVYLAKNKVYQIMMLTPQGEPFPAEDGKLFFDSFNIL